MRKFFIFGLLITAFSVWGQDTLTRRIEDDSSLRISLRESWFYEMPGVAVNKRAEYYTLNGGSRVQVRAEAGRDEFVIVLARELPMSFGPTIPAGSFPGWAQGSWILSRRMSDGALTRIRVFPRSDPNTYIQFRPFSSDKCYMDVVVYEAYLLYSFPIAIPFERLLTLPIEEVFAAAGEHFPRRYFDPAPELYRDKWAFNAAVRSRLPGLEFADDGAIDENGNYVFIETLNLQNPASSGTRGGLNCSGFVKWIVDGILKPVTGELLSIAPLKQAFGNRGSPSVEPYEIIRDTFFGLDWNRNLASRAGTILRSPSFAVLEEIEVRTSTFSLLIARENGSSEIRSYPGFLPDAGYGVDGLHALLYTLAIDEPGRIYLAAVNNESSISNPAERIQSPRLRQYFHTAVLVPFFNENGVFQVAVFESAVETPSFTSFRNRYPGHYVNLVRVPVEGAFNPD